jgi:hypothetical protein
LPHAALLIKSSSASFRRSPRHNRNIDIHRIPAVFHATFQRYESDPFHRAAVRQNISRRKTATGKIISLPNLQKFGTIDKDCDFKMEAASSNQA